MSHNIMKYLFYLIRHEHTAASTKKSYTRDECSTTNVISIHDQEGLQYAATRRSMRKRSTTEQFVAQPSKSGAGAKDGDEEFFATGNNTVASLTEAAASGCRKCQQELDTGVKTRKVHTEHCLRKRRSVATMNESEDESDDEEEVFGKGRTWTAEEDKELVKRVRLHGEGSWKTILGKSRILQERYEAWSSGTFGFMILFLEPVLALH